MSSQDLPPVPVKADHRVLIGLLVVVSAGLVWILVPFFGTILWGTIIALLFSPVDRWLLVRMPGRRTLAALLTLLIVLVIVILPFALITASLSREALALYARLQSGELTPERYFERIAAVLPDWIRNLLERAGLVDFASLQQRLTAGLSQAGQYIATQALAIGQNTFEFITSLFIALYLAFFLIRDGHALVRTMRRAIPLASDQQRELGDTFATVIRATVKGNLLVAAIQGALGGLAFWFLDVTGAMLWAALMAFLSLLPAVGAALVWLPVALYFVISGELVKGIGLIVYGVLVIGLVDNLLRPLLVGRDIKLPDYLVLITTLGGIAVFGINGFVIGPAIMAMFIAVWQLYARSNAEQANDAAVTVVVPASTTASTLQVTARAQPERAAPQAAPVTPGRPR